MKHSPTDSYDLSLLRAWVFMMDRWWPLPQEQYTQCWSKSLVACCICGAASVNGHESARVDRQEAMRPPVLSVA